MKQLPIGIQSFEKLRNVKAVYIDKTEHMLNLINNGSVYFLSRPRRFGKSLLVSTLKALFQGKKELFDSLYIYDKWDWNNSFPVIHLDFSEIAYKTVSLLEISLLDFVNATAEKHGVELSNSPLPSRFAQLIEKLHEKTGSPVVILVDEYDKPLIDNIGREAYGEVKRTLHDFYQVIKASDEHLKFVLLTGVSRFSGLSIFSGLNNLNDVTMNQKYLTICGYTQEELEENFKEHIEETSKQLGINYDETIKEIKNWYNGYSWDGKTSVYNPFSTLMFFENREFKDYWYKTGTPTFLIEQIVKKNGLERLIGRGSVIISSLSDTDYDRTSSIDLLFQTGYLTITSKELSEDRTPQYKLDFPNMEVKKAFLRNLLEVCVNRHREEIDGIGKRIREAIEGKDAKRLKEVLTELYANVPYNLIKKEEASYHVPFIFAAILSGFETDGEVHTDKGRIDAVLKKEGKTTIVEIKYGEEVSTKELVEEAIKQIRDKRYYEKYGKRDVSLLGIGFGKGKEIECEFEDIYPEGTKR